MILRPTVLILGAGASQPYGYPLGEGLVRAIVERTERQAAGELYQVVLPNPPLARIINEFHQRLEKSETGSIDDFLESHPSFAELGKICIAGTLTVWGPPADPRPLDQHHWYRYLWRLLHQGAPTIEAFKTNRLRIITYNYDRSFERYFGQVIHYNYPGVKPQAAVEIQANTIPVVHLHGSLGASGDEILMAEDRSPYKELQTLKTIAAGIRIVHEASESADYVQAHEWLRWGQVICFLGFGYHPTNVQRLDVLGAVSGKSDIFVGGTAFGMGQTEIARAEAALKLGGSILKPLDSLAYLRQVAPL